MGNKNQVLLLATSETQKLDPLTKHMPGAMIPLVNKPIMAHSVELLARQGFKHFFVSLLNLANQIEAYFGSGQRWGVNIEYILQQQAWGTAGSIKWAQGLLKDTFIVMPGDAIVNVDINEALKTHHANNAGATLVVSPNRMGDNRSVILDPGGYVLELREESYYRQPYFDTGIYILNFDLVEMIPARTVLDIYTQLVPSLLEMGIRVAGHITDSYWNPLESFSDYHLAQRAYLQSAMFGRPKIQNSYQRSSFNDSTYGTQISRGIWVGRHNVIHPTARIAPPVVIGDHCRIGRDTEIGPDVIIGTNVIIDDEATIKNSTIIDQTYVGRLVNISKRFVNKDLIINSINGESLRITDYFLLGPIYQTDIGNSIRKRFDQVFALAILLFFSPFLLVLGLLIYMTSGHIFQTVACQRSLRNPANTFNLIRFHTRKTNGQPTWIGNWLEKTNLHRIPELLNVIKGELYLVGVKPLSKDEVKQIKEEWQRKRFEFPPGFTGLWFIQTDRDSTLDEVLIADAYYTATRTWQEDVRLLGKTIINWAKQLMD